MQRPATQTPTTTQSESASSRGHVDLLHLSSPSGMAVTTQQNTHYTLPHVNYRDQRPTLPPLTSLESAADRHAPSPLTTPPISARFNNLDPFNQRHILPQPSPTSRNVGIDSRYQQVNVVGGQQMSDAKDQYRQAQLQGPQDAFGNPLKRSFGVMAQPSAR